MTVDWIDKKYRLNKSKYVFQCLLATLSVFILLLILSPTTNTAIIAALGASSFIVFTMPGTQSSRARFLIGGYLMGMSAGIGCHWIMVMVPMDTGNFLSPIALYGSLSVGLSVFLMVVTNTEHPPAAGLALALILNEWTFTTILIVLVGIVFLSLLRSLLRPFLMNLL